MESEAKVELVAAFSELPPGAHLCCLYQHKEERRLVVTAFLRARLEQGDRVVLIVDAPTSEALEASLREDGLELERLLEGDQLVLLPSDEAYLSGGAFSPERMLSLLRRETEAAKRGGFAGLSVTGEMTWALRGAPGSELLIEYERELNDALTEQRALCQYDRRRFPPELLLDVLRTHPSVVSGADLYENFYYQPPEELQGRELAQRTLERWERNLERRQRRERALRESERWFRIAFERLPCGLLLVDDGARTLAANEAVCRMLGYDEAALKALGVVGTSHPEDVELHASAFQGLREGRSRAYEVEQRLIRRDGQTIWVHITGAQVDEPGGRGTAFAIALVTEVTEQRRAGEEQRQLEQRVRQAHKLESLGMMAGGIAHDFNNLLLAVIGNASLALESLPRYVPERRYLEEIELAAQRAAELSEQMLAYSGRGSFETHALDLTALVEELAPMLRAAASKSAAWTFELSEELPTVEADASQLTQVVINLVTNASEALVDGEGTITVRTGTIHCDRSYLRGTYLDDGLPEGLYTYIEVEDDGVGMDEATKAKLFDPFFSTKFTGRGLGLAVVWGTVRAHHGAIGVESAPGEGTRLRVLLPAAEERRTTLGALYPEASPAPEAVSQGPLVLVVDDDDQVLKISQHILERAGFEVALAESGEVALKIFGARGEEIDCVVLDLTMPRMDGQQVLQAFHHERPRLPVLMTSGYHAEVVRKRLSDLRPAGFLQKPYKPHELLQKVTEILGSKERRFEGEGGAGYSSEG